MIATNLPALRVVHDATLGSAPDFDRTFDVESEGAVLSNVLWDPRMLHDVQPILKSEQFYSERHRLIYEAIVELAELGEAIDVTSVQNRLRSTGRLAQCGGSEYLTEVVCCAPVLHVRHLLTHARAVRELWARRKLLQLGEILCARVRGDDAGVGVLMDDARRRIDELSTVIAAEEKSTRSDAIVERTITEMRNASQTDGIGTRPMGFARLDRITAGLHNELVLVGARPGMGKTSFATAVAVNVAARGEGVFIASLETVETQLMARMLCAEAHIDVSRARVGAMKPNDWSRLMDVSGRIHRLPLWINETSGMSTAELWAHCRRVSLELFRAGRKLGLVVVDYVQLLRGSRPGMKREEVVGENARALKAMSQELECTVLGLAQLNREVDKRTDRRPQLSDLRESGELEQCARTVLMLYREDYYAAKKPGYRPTGVVEVCVAKQNNGPTGTALLHFEATSTRFDNLTNDDDSDGRYS